MLHFEIERGEFLGENMEVGGYAMLQIYANPLIKRRATSNLVCIAHHLRDP